MSEKSIQTNDLAEKALTIMRESFDSLFLTGKAGTGKSTLLNTFVEDSGGKNIIKLAPTGVSALTIGGVTIHRFFGFPIDITVEKVLDGDFFMKRDNRSLLAKADTIVIDEISMVRADMFDIIDTACREILHSDEPFAGKQIIMIGDLFQLPPIFQEAEMEAFRGKYASEFFFSSRAFQALQPYVVELQRVYRQEDREFIHTLNIFRLGLQTEQELDYINRAAIDTHDEMPQGTIILTATKKRATMLNGHMLQRLNTPMLSNEATVKGKFPQTLFPTEFMLQFREGAQVMMIKNHKDGLYHNGTIGIVKGLMSDTEGKEFVMVEIDGEEHPIQQEPWDVVVPRYDDELQSIQYETIGTFKQYPFMLGWAITIHKSQGLTFESVCIDLGYGAFAKGQTYVALSRATHYDGIYLNRPVAETDILVDERIVRFMGKSLCNQKKETIEDALEGGGLLKFYYLINTDQESGASKQVKPIELYEEEHGGRVVDVMKAVIIDEIEGEIVRKFAVEKMFDVEYLG